MRQPASPDRKAQATQRTRDVWIYALAWIATLFTGPLAVVIASGQPPSADIAASVLFVAWMFWGLPLCVGAMIVWPVVRILLTRTALLRWPLRTALRLAGGFAAGLTVGLWVGLVPVLALRDSGNTHFLGWSAGVGAVSGLIWATWFVALGAVLRQKS